jgi:hypothetical protein
MAALMVLEEKEPKCWESFSKPFTPPPGTEYIRLWIHSMTSAVVDGVIDDIEIR